MPTILKIGHQQYIVKNDGCAAAVCKALIGAIQMDSKLIKVDGNYKDFFWPYVDRNTTVSIETVSRDQILQREPTPAEATAHAAMKHVGDNATKLLG